MPRLRQQVRAFRLLSLCDGMIALIATRFAQDLQLSFKIMQHMSRAPAEGEAGCGRAAIEGFLFALYRPSRQARCTMPINDASSEAPVVMVTLPYDLWRLGPDRDALAAVRNLATTSFGLNTRLGAARCKYSREQMSPRTYTDVCVASRRLHAAKQAGQKHERVALAPSNEPTQCDICQVQH